MAARKHWIETGRGCLLLVALGATLGAELGYIGTRFALTRALMRRPPSPTTRFNAEKLKLVLCRQGAAQDGTGKGHWYMECQYEEPATGRWYFYSVVDNNSGPLETGVTQ